MYQGILYPFAKNSSDEWIHIDKATQDGNYFCLECANEMIPRQGEINRWHFAHKNSVDGISSEHGGEGVLHRMAKELILRGVEEHNQIGDGYWLRWHHDLCQKIEERDLTTTTIIAEHQLPIGVRPDLWVEGSFQCALEIVVSHALEPITLAKYQESGIPVLYCRITYSNLSVLSDNCFADGYYHLDYSECPECNNKKLQHQTGLLPTNLPRSGGYRRQLRDYISDWALFAQKASDPECIFVVDSKGSKFRADGVSYYCRTHLVRTSRADIPCHHGTGVKAVYGAQ